EASPSGTSTAPRICQVFPLSVVTTIFALSRVRRQVETGNAHSPLERTVGLHIMTPSIINCGALHSIEGSSPDSAFNAHRVGTALAKTLCPASLGAWDQNNHNR